MSLQTLVYTSVAKEKLTHDQLIDLLHHSRIKNSQAQITGMLLYLDPYFIQVLEGQEDALSETFKRILEDTRHHKVSIIYKKNIEQRFFSKWTMGFNIIDHNKIEHLDGFSDFLQKPTSEFFSQPPAYISELLTKFRKEILF